MTGVDRVFWPGVKRRALPFAAVLALLASSAPVPNLFCRLECEAEASARAAVENPAPSDSCHAAAPRRGLDPESSRSSGPCKRHARPCALTASSEAKPASGGPRGFELAAIPLAPVGPVSRLEPARGSELIPPSQASPPSGVCPSVLRL